MSVQVCNSQMVTKAKEHWTDYLQLIPNLIWIFVNAVICNSEMQAIKQIQMHTADSRLGVKTGLSGHFK